MKPININIYDVNGYIDIRTVLSIGMPFTFIVGGRGIGKTYTALKTLLEDGEPFLLLRRTQKQCDLISREEFSPLAPVCLDNDWHYGTASISKDSAGIYKQVQDEQGKWINDGPPIGITAALSTISSLRGFDASWVRTILYDEFIPEKHERPMKEEGEALMNAYETINRNRELKGQPPVRLLALANAMDLGNPVFLHLGLVAQAEKNVRKGKEIWVDPARGICLIIVQRSPISAAKKRTALYKLNSTNAFAEMALNNKFSHEYSSNVSPQPLKEYRLLVTIGELSIYKHKSEPLYYASLHASGTAPVFGTSDVELARAARSFGWLVDEYLEDKIRFEEYTAEMLFTRYLY